MNGLISSGATSATLTTGSFGSPTGTQLLVLDYDNGSLEVISCTITGTALTAITRALDGTSAVSHSNGAKVIMALVPSHYTQLGGLAASDAFTSWTPSFTGFSVNPTAVTAKYFQVGKLVFCYFDESSGTSNATSFTLTLPVAAKFAVSCGGMATIDNSAILTTPGRLILTAGSTVATAIKDTGVGSTWTNTGAKGIFGSWFYEAN